MRIIPLSEGSFTIDKSKLFVPYDLQKDTMEQRSTGSLLVEVQPFIVVTSKDVLLLDTGLGFEKEGKLQLYTNIMEAGINPAEITKVLLSHLHKDHAGAVGSGKGTELTFPDATYYVQRSEFSFALEKGSPSFITEELVCLGDKKQVQWLEGNGTIDGYIDYEVTAAHSPWHQVFWIRDDNEILFFGADDAPQLQQMKHRFAAKYDYDGKKAMELRQQWWKKGSEENWTFLFYHDIKTPFLKL